MKSVIEIFRRGRWIPAAEFVPIGAGPYMATFEYLIDYVFGEEAPVPVSLALPVRGDRVGVDASGKMPPCPAFLLDLVPQGRGRRYLANEIGVCDGEQSDLLLAQHGAFNPVGNLRLDTAVKFYRERTERQPAAEGFPLDEILLRKDEFLEHLWIHTMLAAGTTGVQGAAPKFLLTQDVDGLWFADAALPDERAARHWLIKLPRGSHETDYTILRNEAAYLRVARECGLRVGVVQPEFHQDMLFVPRFDRLVDDTGLHRLHQESLASLAGLRGFGLSASLFDLVAAFRTHVTDPVAEIVEFIKRDILNMAMRNTDNHARNTAVQRLPNGVVQLAPVFDFAPMYMDREFVVRGCRWRIGRGAEIQSLEEIVERTVADDSEGVSMLRGVKSFQVVIERLPEVMRDCGVEAKVIDDCRPSIDAQAERLERLAARQEQRHGQASQAR